MTSKDALMKMAAEARGAIADPKRITIAGNDTRPRFELFHAASSLCSLKVRTVLSEKALPYRSSEMIRICRMSALCVMKQMMRIWPPHSGHSSANTS